MGTRVELCKKGLVFSRVLRDSTPRFVVPSVGWSIRPSHFTFGFGLRVGDDRTRAMSFVFVFSRVSASLDYFSLSLLLLTSSY